MDKVRGWVRGWSRESSRGRKNIRNRRIERRKSKNRVERVGTVAVSLNSSREGLICPTKPKKIEFCQKYYIIFKTAC